MALVPLLVAEDRSAHLQRVLRDDPAVVVWWGSPIECVAALARRQREGRLTAQGRREAVERLREGMAHWAVVPAYDDVREQATRLLRVHVLRSADAVQLAAAIVAANFQASSLGFVALDLALAEAAQREGFPIAA